ncbi:MAG: hypothetical protein HPY53_10690 [Brevinematales bacterium]|nr:hypothetical protein [Brevinematales bacterium]
MSLSFNPSDSSTGQTPESRYIQQPPTRSTNTSGGAGRGCLSGFLGFVMFFLLNIVFFLYLSFTISSKPFLMKIGTDTLGVFYDASPDTFASYIIMMKKQFQSSAVSQPFPELNLRISKNEVAGLNDKEIIIFIVTNKFIEPLYEKGDKFAETFFIKGSSGKGKDVKLEKFDYDGEKHSGLYFLTREFHDKIARSFWIFAGICAAIFIIMILINTGFWRFSAVGVTLVLASLPLMGIWFTLTQMIAAGEWLKNTEIPPAFIIILTKMVDPFINLIRSVFLTALISGGACIVIAIILNVLTKAQESSGNSN